MNKCKKISEINIYSFRKLKDVRLDDLKRINVLLGINNSGKTSILEAIGTISDSKSRANVQQWALMRSPAANGTKKEIVDYMTGIFPSVENDLGIISANMILGSEKYSLKISGERNETVSSTGKKGKSLCITVDYMDGTKPTMLKFSDGGKTQYIVKDTKLFNVDYVMVEDDYYGKCVSGFSAALLASQKEQLLELMKEFDSQIEDIFLDEAGDIYIRNKISGILPLFSYGSGMQKAFMLAIVLADPDLDVVMVDEIDSALNVRALQDVLSWFVRSCRKCDIQAFLTTHNAEAIDALLENIDDTNDIKIYTLRNSENQEKTIVKALDGKTAQQYRDEYKMELRV